MVGRAEARNILFDVRATFGQGDDMVDLAVGCFIVHEERQHRATRQLAAVLGSIQRVSLHNLGTLVDANGCDAR